MDKILFFSRDPGGANCIIPLAHHMIAKKEYGILLFGKDKACQRYAQAGIDFKDIKDLLKENISYEHIREFVHSINPVCIVTGTSEDDLAEKYLWKAASEAGIPSVAILDYWNSYCLRFSSAADTVDAKDGVKKCLPDKICIMDDFAKKEMIKEGFSSDVLEITGQPHLSEVRQRLTRVSTDDKNYRKKLGIASGCHVVVVVSEAVRTMYGDKGRAHWGYDEASLLKNTFDALCAIHKEFPQENFCLVFRLHPKDNENILDDMIAGMKNDFIKVVKERGSSSEELICGADILLGASSMLLLEAAIAQKPFLSVQIGQKQQDPFILSRMDKVKRVLSADDLKMRLSAFFSEGQFDKVDFSFLENAVQNIEQVIKKLIGERHGNISHLRR
ncbi:MAG: hypothetical protein WC676_00405 [Candidatus Omnitrophota bacterium]